ncbi:molybdenum cofactor biosynthesis protein B [Halopenitus salinus]|uniref:Molybdenum cofactor biosynthesis protein B n=1 Tax=Halopenitus salinus TaxID=1198295 RepID=A0ABD5UUE4_9EURY
MTDGHDHDHGEDHDHDGTGEHEDHDHGEDHGHDHHAHDLDRVRVAIVTVTSSRTMDDDPSGEFIESALGEAAHEVSVREVIRDDFDAIQGTIDRLVSREDTDAVVTTGGTGVTPDDVTPEAVAPLFEKDLPGFGETFRRLSYEEVGTRTIGSRATAGIADGVPVFCLPGSRNAVRLGMEEIILPEIEHLTGLARREE